MKKIVLVGYMASGKTEIGKLLSKKLHLPFFDIDHLIENEVSKTVNEIFEEKGEIFFRKKEHQVFADKINSDISFVLSLGGGTPCYANNHLLLQDSSCQSFYLQTKIETLLHRLTIEKNNRPVIAHLTDDFT